MKPASPIKKFGIPILAISIVGFLVYFGINNFSSNNSAGSQLGGNGLTSTITDTPVVTTGATGVSNNTASGTVGNTIVELLRNIGSITLPTDIFTDSSFMMLNDGTVSLPPRNNPGRRNPFSTLSGSGTANSINPSVLDSKTLTPQPQAVLENTSNTPVADTSSTPVVLPNTIPSTKTLPDKNKPTSSSFVPVSIKSKI